MEKKPSGTRIVPIGKDSDRKQMMMNENSTICDIAA